MIYLVVADDAPASTILAAQQVDTGDVATFILFCDGTDDQVQVQQAIDGLDSVYGGSVILSPGRFHFSDTVTIKVGRGTNPGTWESGSKGSGFLLEGYGWSSIIRLADNADCYAFTFRDPLQTPGGWGVTGIMRNFKIECRGQSQTDAAGTDSGGIDAQAAVECRFENLWITEPYNMCLRLGPIGNSGAFGHNNVITGCLFDEGDNISIDQANANGGGILIDSNDENVIIASDFQFLGGTGATRAHGNSIRDLVGLNFIQSCNFVNSAALGGVIRVQDTQATTRIEGCMFDGNKGDSIVWANSDHQQAIGNTFTTQGATGNVTSCIYAEFATGDFIISGNLMTSHGTNGLTRSFIRIGGGGTHHGGVITSNQFIRNGTLAQAPIEFDAAASPLPVCENNQYTDFTTKAIVANVNLSARGATSVADGGTISHGLPLTPTSVRVTPSVAGEMASVTALASGTFTVALKTHDNSAGTTQTVYWEASVT